MTKKTIRQSEESKPEPVASTQDKTLSYWLSFVGKYTGIIGGGGAGFAALSFGIGYLAVKSHDAMLGLPTTLSNYESYVRIGALFFSNSLYSLVTTSTTIPKATLIAALLVFVVALVLSSHLSRRKPLWLIKIPLGYLIIAYALISFAAFLSTERISATLHPDNKSLLLKLPEEVKATGYAKRIYDLLRKEGGADELQREYSLHLAQTVALLYGAFVLYRWRKKVIGSHSDATSDEVSSPDRPVAMYISDWTLRPLLYTLLIFHLILLPSSYGVLCLSNEYPQAFIVLEGGNSPEDSGFLLSDMSVDLPEIVWVQPDETGNIYAHYFFKKDDIKSIDMVASPAHRNILYVP